MLLLAFKSYKDSGTIGQIIRLSEQYDYVHTELVFCEHGWQSFSVSTHVGKKKTGVVMFNEFNEAIQRPEYWKFYVLPVSDFEAEKCYQEAQSMVGVKYNFKGILGRLLGRSITNPDRRFCSEVIFETLAKSTSLQLPIVAQYRVTPEELHRWVLEKKYEEYSIKSV